MNAFIAFLYRLASWRSLGVVTALYLTFPLYFLKNAEERINALSGKKVNIIDLTMDYDTERTRQYLSDYTLEARAYYAQVEATVDVAYPLVYAFLFALILALLFRRSRFGVPDWVVVLPFVIQLLDYTENFFIYQLLTQYPDFSEGLLIGCEVAKVLKWGGVLVIIGLIVYGIVRQLLVKLRP